MSFHFLFWPKASSILSHSFFCELISLILSTFNSWSSQSFSFMSVATCMFIQHLHLQLLAFMYHLWHWFFFSCFLCFLLLCCMCLCLETILVSKTTMNILCVVTIRSLVVFLFQSTCHIWCYNEFFICCDYKILNVFFFVFLWIQDDDDDFLLVFLFLLHMCWCETFFVFAFY